MSKYSILEYSYWGKLRIIRKVEIPDREPQCVVYRYKVQRQKRFLFWKYWHTELSCNSRKLAREVYFELMDQIREKL